MHPVQLLDGSVGDLNQRMCSGGGTQIEFAGDGEVILVSRRVSISHATSLSGDRLSREGTDSTARCPWHYNYSCASDTPKARGIPCEN